MLMRRYAQCWRRLKYATVYSVEQLLKDKKNLLNNYFLSSIFEKYITKQILGQKRPLDNSV